MESRKYPYHFKTAAFGRYVRLVLTHVLDDEPQVAVPEIGLLAD